MTIEEKHVDYLTVSKSAVARAPGDTAEVKMSAVGALTTDTAWLKFSSVAAAMVRKDASLSWCNAQLATARNNMTLTNSGGQLLAAGNTIEVRRGGAAIMAARTIQVQRGVVGVLLAQQATLGDETRVLLQPAAAAAMGAGFAAGALAGLVLGGTFRRRRRGKD